MKGKTFVLLISTMLFTVNAVITEPYLTTDEYSPKFFCRELQNARNLLGNKQRQLNWDTSLTNFAEITALACNNTPPSKDALQYYLNAEENNLGFLFSFDASSSYKFRDLKPFSVIPNVLKEWSDQKNNIDSSGQCKQGKSCDGYRVLSNSLYTKLGCAIAGCPKADNLNLGYVMACVFAK